MNDITALALLVSKAKASVFTMEYISQFEASDIDSDDVDLRFEVDGVETGTNVSIVDECGQAAQMIRALVEALEKAQQYAKERDEENQGLMLTVGRLRTEREALESRTVTVKLPKAISVLHRRDFIDAHRAIYAYPEAELNAALAAAGIQVIEGEGQ